MRTLLSIALACILGVAVYLGWRYVSATNFAHLRNFASANDVVDALKKVPPFQCAQRLSAGGQTIETHMYASDKRLRTDVRDANTNDTAHYIISEDGFFAWKDGTGNIYTIDADTDVTNSEQNPLNMALINGGGDCSIWWSPDESLFAVPTDLEMHDYSTLQ